MEASFSSKIVATIHSNLPVWDEFILNNFGLKKPLYGMKDIIGKTVNLYNSIIKWYEDFLPTGDGRRVVDLFDEKYKGIGITDTKKID